MQQSSTSLNPPTFAGLLGLLARQKFRIGVDHHLRLQRVLQTVSGECDVRNLKTLLCPVFATSVMQQKLFYETFDRYFDALLSPTRRLDVQRPVEQRREATETREASPALTHERLKPKPKWLYAVAFAAVFLLGGSFAWWKLRPRSLVPPVQQPPKVAARQGVPPTPPVTTLAPQPQVPGHSELQHILDALRWAAVPMPLILLGLYELLRYQRRKAVLQRKPGRKPPYQWQFELEETAPRFLDSEFFYHVARLMRQRQTGEGRRVDVEATIAATVQSAGYPTLQYNSDTRPPEYLMLVESASPRDHEGLWFNLLAQQLQDEGVYLTPYFYNQDPRMCWSADGTDRVDLDELNKRHGSHRLLLVGDGDALLDPITGRLLDWASTFLRWPERALLTPQPPAHWSWREFTLADSFAVLPATLDGMVALMDHFDALGNQELRSWRGDEQPCAAPRWENPAAVFNLRSYLGEAAFRWLCVCAIYPELQWGLTLRLGVLPYVRKEHINEQSLLRLFRLPWFRAGAIPDEWRSVLVSHLDDATRNKVCEVLVAQLEGGLKQQEKLPGDSWAADACRFQLAVQQGWLARADPKRLAEILKRLGNWPRKRLLQDVTVVQLLEGASTWGLRLPDRLRHALFPEGLPVFGFATTPRTLCAILATAALLISVPKRSSPDTGAVVGAVKDQFGLAVPNAAVTLSKAGISTVTGSDGRYGLTHLTRGTYTVLVEAPGFQKATRAGVTVNAGQREVVDFTLSATANRGLARVKIVAFTAQPASLVVGEKASLCYEVHQIAETGPAEIQLLSLHKVRGNMLANREQTRIMQDPKGCFVVSPQQTTTYMLQVRIKDQNDWAIWSSDQTPVVAVNAENGSPNPQNSTDPRTFWLLNNTGKQITQFYVSPHQRSDWGSDVLGLTTLPDGRRTIIYFDPAWGSSCIMDFKLVFSDRTTQTFTQGRDVCRLNAVQFNSDDSIGSQ